MARVNVPVQIAAGDAVGKDITAGWTVADADNDHSYLNGGGKVVLFVRTAGASGVDVTVKSVADPYGRTGDLGPTTVGASKYYAFGPYSPGLFNQSGADLNKVFVDLAALSGTVHLLALGW